MRPGDRPVRFSSGCAVSSVVEHFLDTEGVRGSNPLSRTIFTGENAKVGASDTVFTQETPESGADPAKDMKFPKPGELRALLEASESDVLPVIAFSGLAGIRIEECLRLDWADVWRVQDKVEISARIAKDRQRRLVTICPALAAWLEPFRHSSGPVCGERGCKHRCCCQGEMGSKEDGQKDGPRTRAAGGEAKSGEKCCPQEGTLRGDEEAMALM